jgi:hypothetical protein
VKRQSVEASGRRRKQLLKNKKKEVSVNEKETKCQRVKLCSGFALCDAVS